MKGWMRLLLALWLSEPAWSALAFHEAWLGGLALEGEMAAWGAYHVWRGGVTQGAQLEEGLPEGVVALLPATNGLWALTGAGELRRLGAEPESWSAGGWREACPAGLGRAWLLDDWGLTLVTLEDGASPEALARVPLAQAAELRPEGEVVWLRQGARLWRITAQGREPGGVLPAGWKEWAPWRGDALCLDERGRLCRVPPLPQDIEPHGPLPDLRLDRLRRVPGALWLRGLDGAWWRWPEDKAGPACVEPAVDREEGAGWLPVSAHDLLRQDAESRQWWSDEAGVWHATLSLPRPARLVDRLVRWSGSWSLDAGGSLELERPGRRQWLGRWPGAISLHPAGAGPLLLTAQGLTAFSEGGAVIGGWSGRGGLVAASLEDGLLLAGEELLRTFWTDEEDPWLQDELPLPEAVKLSASPSWAAVLAEGQIRLVDRADPWAPHLLGARPAPAGLADFLLAEDRLLLVSESWSQAWSCRGGEWQPLPPLTVDLRGSWLCLRGANRLLALDRRGRLRQFRLADNLPVSEDWCQRLPLAGRMALGQDSLRVLGEAGWLDWPLPALESPAPAEAIAASEPIRVVDAGSDLSARRVGGALRLAWDARRGPATLRLHDLLGRRLREARGGPELLLDMAGLPAGLYLVQGRWADGRTQARAVHWLP